MADNVAISAGTGTTVATDQVGAIHYQRVKISDATADSSTHLKIVAEDAVHASGDTGIVAMVVRNDTLAALAGADGDYSVLQVDADGALYITAADLATIAAAINAEDAVHGSGDTGIMALAVRNDTLAALAGADGDYAPFQVDADGALFITAADLATLAGAVTGSEMQVDVVAALPAGSNAIGKLAANSGVDIGDVDVTSLPASIDGAGAPTIDSYATAAINLAASTASQELVADPGGSKQIWVYGLYMMADTAAGTVLLTDEDDTALSGVMAVSDEGGWVLNPSGNFGMPWIIVTTNKALDCDTGACTVDGIITYAIVSV